jgi:hypothetical protein
MNNYLSKQITTISKILLIQECKRSSVVGYSVRREYLCVQQLTDTRNKRLQKCLLPMQWSVSKELARTKKRIKKLAEFLQ